MNRILKHLIPSLLRYGRCKEEFRGLKNYTDENRTPVSPGLISSAMSLHRISSISESGSFSKLFGVTDLAFNIIDCGVGGWADHGQRLEVGLYL